MLGKTAQGEDPRARRPAIGCHAGSKGTVGSQTPTIACHAVTRARTPLGQGRRRRLAVCLQTRSVSVTSSRILSSNLGFPRIGTRRELKTALESFWSNASNAETLRATAASLRARHWFAQQKAGIDHIPSNDFSLYDQMLDTIAMLGAVPPRFGHAGGHVPLDLYFAMARDAPT